MKLILLFDASHSRHEVSNQASEFIHFSSGQQIFWQLGK